MYADSDACDHSMLSADDAAKLEIPFGCYISNDEPVDEVSTSPFLSGLFTAHVIPSSTRLKKSSPRSRSRIRTTSSTSIRECMRSECVFLAHSAFSCSFHGWAAARANLDDPDNKAKYVPVPLPFASRVAHRPSLQIRRTLLRSHNLYEEEQRSGVVDGNVF